MPARRRKPQTLALFDAVQRRAGLLDFKQPLQPPWRGYHSRSGSLPSLALNPSFGTGTSCQLLTAAAKESLGFGVDEASHVKVRVDEFTNSSAWASDVASMARAEST